MLSAQEAGGKVGVREHMSNTSGRKVLIIGSVLVMSGQKSKFLPFTTTDGGSIVRLHYKLGVSVFMCKS